MPGALRRAPGPHPKSARAYALAMCAPRTCLSPPKKLARAYALAMCAPRTCLPKKIGPQQFKKIRAHVCPPIINRCPLLAPPPPHFLNPGAATVDDFNSSESSVATGSRHGGVAGVCHTILWWKLHLHIETHVLYSLAMITVCRLLQIHSTIVSLITLRNYHETTFLLCTPWWINNGCCSASS